MISKIPIDTDKKIIERYEKRADFTVLKYWIDWVFCYLLNPPHSARFFSGVPRLVGSTVRLTLLSVTLLSARRPVSPTGSAEGR